MGYTNYWTPTNRNPKPEVLTKEFRDDIHRIVDVANSEGVNDNLIPCAVMKGMTTSAFVLQKTAPNRSEPEMSFDGDVTYIEYLHAIQLARACGNGLEEILNSFKGA